MLTQLTQLRAEPAAGSGGAARLRGIEKDKGLGLTRILDTGIVRNSGLWVTVRGQGVADWNKNEQRAKNVWFNVDKPLTELHPAPKWRRFH